MAIGNQELLTGQKREQSSTSWQLRMIRPMLFPLRTHINHMLNWSQSQENIFLVYRKIVDQGHPWITQSTVHIKPLVDGSEYLVHFRSVIDSPTGAIPGPNLDHRKLLIYFHGGAFLVGSPESVRPITSYLVTQTPGLVCYSVRYPLVKMPISQLISVANSIYVRIRASGWQPKQIFLGGDSAGGHLALQLFFHLLAGSKSDLGSSGDPGSLVAGLVLFSPWLDLTGELAIDDSIIYGNNVRQVGKLLNLDQLEYVKLQDHPQIDQLPRTFLQFAESEIVSVENRQFANRAQQTGVAIQVDQIPGLFHGFQYFANWIPECQRALDQASKFLQQ